MYCLSLFIDVAKFPRKQLRKEEFALAHGLRGLSLDLQGRNMIEEHSKGKLFLPHFNGEVGGGHFREKMCLQNRAPVNYFLQMKVTS